ncbi:MAG: hypothetical protein FWG55_03800 [Candidatus Bathyarchaeota archaeon]|nr:hypothetical protein [Candidatus Termiticorpusculum sp.]
MEHSAEKFENEVSLVCMDELSVDMDAESFYKFNWRLYIDDEFQKSFYENPKKALEQAGLSNIPLSNANLKQIEPLTSEEHEILQLLNSSAYTPLRAEEWWYEYENVATAAQAVLAVVAVGSEMVAAGYQVVVVVVLIGAPADRADMVPEILRKKE